MCHDFLSDATFWQNLSRLDQLAAEQVREQGCAHCGARLHSACYPRKPRGVSRSVLGEQYECRLSYCCAREGCRKRCTPPSVRFLGRKVYLGVVITLICAFEQGLTPRRRARLVDELDHRRYDPEPPSANYCRAQADLLFQLMEKVRIMPRHTSIDAQVLLQGQQAWSWLEQSTQRGPASLEGSVQ